MKRFVCETCGGSIPGGKNKCEYCGSTYTFYSNDDRLKIDGIHCDACNEINPPGTNYCDDCGSQLTQPCKSCGTKFSKFRENCPNCGKFNKLNVNSNIVDIGEYYKFVEISDFNNADKLFHSLEKSHHNNVEFLYHSIMMYTKWGMSFDSDETMSNYSARQMP